MTHEEVRARMEEGRIYPPDDEGILHEQLGCLELLYDYNATRPHELSKRRELMKKMFAEVGENMLKISGEPLGEETDNNTDVSQIARGHITVSPVTLDMNDYALLARLKEEFPL